MAKVVYFPRCGHTGERVRVLVEDKSGQIHAKDICLACAGKFFGMVRTAFEREAAEANQLRFEL